MTDESDKLSYPIGYKKPPKATQFAPGQCGNRKGRPKGSKNFATALQDELKTRIVITEGGKRKKISKREAIAKQLVNKAAAGDPKAIPILFNETRIQENLPPPVAPENVPTSEEDQRVMDSIISRIQAAHGPEVHAEAAPEPNPDTSSSSSSPTEPEPKP